MQESKWKLKLSKRLNIFKPINYIQSLHRRGPMSSVYKRFILATLIIIFYKLFATSCLAHSSFPQMPKETHEPILENSINAIRSHNAKIQLDGKLDEKVWQEALKASDFIQNEPDEGQPATEKTTLQIIYDDEYFYVGMRANDSQPDKLRGILTRRDEETPSDELGFVVDSYNDKRTGFLFAVNPVGVKRDIRFSDDHDEDPNWDAVWDVSISTDEQGWTAEFRIPFSQLRFSAQNDQTWGFQAF